MQGEPGVGGAGRQVGCQRREQVEQALGLGNGQRDNAAVGRRGLSGVLGQHGRRVRLLLDAREHGQERKGGHGQGDMALPRPIQPDLRLVESDGGFRVLEIILHLPARRAVTR